MDAAQRQGEETPPAVRLYALWGAQSRSGRVQRAAAAVDAAQVAAFAAKYPSCAPLFQFLLRASGALASSPPATLRGARARLAAAQAALQAATARLAQQTEAARAASLQAAARERRAGMHDTLTQLLQQHACTLSELAASAEHERLQTDDTVCVDVAPFRRWVRETTSEGAGGGGGGTLPLPTHIWDAEHADRRPSVLHMVRTLQAQCQDPPATTTEGEEEEEEEEEYEDYGEVVARLQRDRVATLRAAQALRAECERRSTSTSTSTIELDAETLHRRKLFFTLAALQQRVAELTERTRVHEERCLPALRRVQTACAREAACEAARCAQLERLCELFRCEREHCVHALGSLRDTHASLSPGVAQTVAATLAPLAEAQRVAQAVRTAGVPTVAQTVRWLLACRSCPAATARACDRLAPIAFAGTPYPQHALAPARFLAQLRAVLDALPSAVPQEQQDEEDEEDEEDEDESEKARMALVARTERHVEAVMRLTESCQSVVADLVEQPAQHVIPPEMRAHGRPWSEWQRLVEESGL